MHLELLEDRGSRLLPLLTAGGLDAVFCRRLAERIEEPTLKSLVENIASDEERHELFFANLVRWCIGYDEEATVGAVARRAAALQTIGADIDAYQGKVVLMVNVASKCATSFRKSTGPARYSAIMPNKILV
mgnify:CR=1 FL=1